MHPLKIIKICFSVCFEIKYANVLLLHLCLIKKALSNYSYVSSKRKKSCKNKVNDTKFVNFNTVFPKKYHSAHYSSFKSCLTKLLGNKITNFYQKRWLLIFKMVAQRFEGWWKFSIFILFFFFTFINNYPKTFLCSSRTQRC